MKFQSTPPRRRRLQLFCVTYLKQQISIHASAKEATFQISGAHIAFIYFNPRLREGGDDGVCVVTVGTTISIHASAKEATACSNGIYGYREISIHASAKEATGRHMLSLF